MNRVVVARAAAGLAAYLTSNGLNSNGLSGPVVIGYDGRHNSDIFAMDTAQIMAGAGLTALVLPRPLPTPVVAFAVKRLGGAAGVMVTASHNPPRDNGYKVYLGDGCQIVSPADQQIAEHIAAVGSMNSIVRSDAWTRLDDSIVDDYNRCVARLAPAGPRELTVAYTPMHGVGVECTREVLALAGFAAPHVVALQEWPDPDFPTVAFPNPEEPGAMDLVLGLGAQVNADLVIANDPDADRCAAAIPTAEGGFRVLRGDELGALLGDYVVRRGATGTLANSIVSSSLLSKIAAAAGLPHVETLTGFKWIGRVPGLSFGYEEALGYCVDPAEVSDKDGISALLALCQLAAETKAAGRTLQDLLDDLAHTHGLHATDQLSIRVADTSLIAQAMATLRTSPPKALGGIALTCAEDLALGTATLPPTDGLRYLLDGGARVIVRPSGTEPKLKCYLEVVVPVTTSIDSARSQAAAFLAAIKSDMADALAL